MIDINIISYRFTDPYFLQMFFAFLFEESTFGNMIRNSFRVRRLLQSLDLWSDFLHAKQWYSNMATSGKSLPFALKKISRQFMIYISILIYPFSWWMLQGIPGVSLPFLGEELCVSIITSFGNHRDVLEGCALRHEWLVLHPCTIPSNFPNYIKLFFVQDQIQFKRHVDASWFETLFSWCYINLHIRWKHVLKFHWSVPFH